MDRFNRFIFIFLALLSITVANSKAQENNLYCIGVKQSFSSWGSCSGNPDFSFAVVKINDASTLWKKLTVDSLDNVLFFGEGYSKPDADKDVTQLKFDGSPLSKITVLTYATDISNDHLLSYTFDGSNLKIGETTLTRDASDPCSNNFNWSGGREGYTMTTTIYIDDPINITVGNPNTNSSYNIETEALTLQVGDYYDNRVASRPELQVALDDGGNGGWVKVPNVVLAPNSIRTLTYEKIAGRKTDPSSNFFKWMGHRLKFRVVKTLLNGKQTVGQSVAGVVFYPQGPQFTINQIFRTSCSDDKVILTVTLVDAKDQGYFTIDKNYYRWVVVAGEGNNFSDSYNCTMSRVSGKLNDFIISLTNDKGDTVDPFSDNNSAPVKWTMQLQDLTEEGKGKNYCVRSFTIPPKPPFIDVAQKHLDFNINGTLYDVPDMNHPYVMLNIDDSWEYSYLRRPYKVMEGNDVLLSLDSLPGDYSKMSPAEQKQWDDLYNVEFTQMAADPTNPNNAYRSYFDLKLRQWCQSHSAVGTPLDLARGYSPVFSPNNKSYLFLGRDADDYQSDQGDDGYDSRFDVYLGSTLGSNPVRLTVGSKIYFSDGSLAMHPNGTEYYYVQRDYDGVNYTGFRIYRAPITGGNGVCISEQLSFISDIKLSPDGSYLYFIGNSSLCRIPANNSIINTATLLVDNISHGLGASRTGLVLTQTGESLYYINLSGFLCKFDLITNASTQLTNVAVLGFAISPDESFFLYSNRGSGNNTRIYKAPIGTSINNGIQITNDIVSVTTNGIYIFKDQASYLFPDGWAYSSDLGEGSDMKPEAEWNTFHKAPIGDLIQNGIKLHPAFRSYGRPMVSNNEGFCIYDRYEHYGSSEQWFELLLFVLDVDKSVEEFRNILFPNKGYAQEWYNTYKAIYKKEWLNKKFGVKVTKDIVVNDTMHLKLVDLDGCEYPFKVFVKAPLYADFDSTIVSLPSNTCTNNGVAKIVFKGGGSTPYVHSAGILRNVGDEITVSGLGYGDNTIQFFDALNNPSATYTIRIDGSAGITDVSSTPQTCSVPNGTVSIAVSGLSGAITYKLKNTDTNDEYTQSSSPFIGIPSGNYSATVTNGGCHFAKNDIFVDSKIFDVGLIMPIDATTITGSGGVSISLINNTNGVSWVNAPSEFNPSETSNNPTYTGIAPGMYSITANHTDANGTVCSVSKTFSIDRPKFEAVANLDETDDGFTATAWLKSGHLISPYTLRLLNSSNTVVAESEPNGTLSESNLAKGDYTIKLHYKILNESSYDNVDICSFSYPLGEFNNVYQITPVACPGGNGTIKLAPTGGINKDILVSIDGSDFTSTRSYTAKGGDFAYYLKSDNEEPTDKGNMVTINKSLVKKFVVPIPEPEPVRATAIPIDASCAGYGDGKVSVAFLKGGSGKYQYHVEGRAWIDTLVVTDHLSPGDYRVYLKDSGNNCDEVYLSDITINQPDSLKVERVEVVQPTCEQSNGAILVEVKGGNGFYKSEWLYNGKPYQKNDTFSEDTIFDLGSTLSSGDYSLEVVDSHSCTVPQSVSLDIYHNPAITNTSVTDVRCYGESNGEVKVLSITGTNPMQKCYIKGFDFAFTDSIEDLNHSFANLKKGRYEIFASDTLGCSSSLPYSVSVDQPDTLVYLVIDNVINVFNKGTASGGIRSTIFGGNSGLKNVRLFNAEGTCIDSSLQRDQFPFNFNALYAGNYTISATDIKGCAVLTEPILVKEPDAALRFDVTEKKDALCKSQVGSITVQASGGWGGYRYKRESYNAFYKRNSFENLYAGNYIITVKDSVGATYSDTVAITEPKDSLRSWVSESLSPTCSNNGELKVGIVGGTAPYSLYNETTNDTLPIPLAQVVNLNGLGAGSHALRITDGNGCRFDLETALSDTLMMRIAFDIPSYPSADNPTGGAIKAIVTGGMQPFTYQWKNRFGASLSEPSATLKDIPSGHYELSVTGTDGCLGVADKYLPGLYDLPFAIAKLGNETSYLAHNGYCKLTSEFSSWKSFNLITPKNENLLLNAGDSTTLFYCKGDTISLQNLEGGDYFISGTTVSDSTVYAEFRIEPYQLFQFRSVSVVNVDTIGANNGEIVVVVTGGGGGNKFEWQRIVGSDGGTLTPQDYPESTVLSNVTAGKFRVVVTDRYDNSIVDTVAVEEPATPLSISIADYKNESCKTYNDAYVTLKAEGGWGDYQFRDDNTPYYTNGDFFDKLGVRTHYFYLTDKMGVVDSVAIPITEPDYLTSQIAFVDSVNCKDGGDGRFEFNVNGGTAPYRFASAATPENWQEGTIAQNIAQGHYRYIFTDANECVGQDTVEVEMYEPDSLLFNKVDVTQTTCNTNNGAVKVLMQGGTQPYRYAWRDFNNELIGTDNFVTKLVQNGLYTLDVYDYHNCNQHWEQRINPSTSPVVTNVDTTPVLCFGGNTGKAFITGVTPGVPYAPYTFTWSNADTGSVASGFSKGVHFVTISDTNKCSTVKYFEITQPDSLRIVLTDRKDAHCFGYNDAFLQAEGRGGVGGYTYRWSTGDTTMRANNLYKGAYQLLLSDANKCLTEESFIVDEPEKLEVDLGDDIKMCPGNSRIIDGQDFATHKWFTAQGTVSNERYYTAKEANDYYLEVTNSIGCFAWDTINVSIGNDALQADFLLSSQAKLGDTLSIFELSNMPLDSLQWDYNNNAFTKISGEFNPDYVLYLKTLKEGIYNVNLYAFSGGCVSVATKQVEIIPESDTLPDDGNLGYKDPLIKSLVVSPNPNDGNFYATVELRETADIDLLLFAIVSSTKVDERFEHGLQNYSVGYNLSGLNSGVYLLILKAGNERKQVKIIIQ